MGAPNVTRKRMGITLFSVLYSKPQEVAMSQLVTQTLWPGTVWGGVAARVCVSLSSVVALGGDGTRRSRCAVGVRPQS